MKQKTVPCKLCKIQTPMLGTKLCDPCWELSWRIEMNPKIARIILNKIESLCEHNWHPNGMYRHWQKRKCFKCGAELSIITSKGGK